MQRGGRVMAEHRTGPARAKVRLCAQTINPRSGRMHWLRSVVDRGIQEVDTSMNSFESARAEHRIDSSAAYPCFPQFRSPNREFTF